MSGKRRIAFVAGGVILIGLFGYFVLSNRDCPFAAQKIRNAGWTFTELGPDGRSDGLGMRWTVAGCVISDDTDSWRVTPWGSVRKL